MTIKMDSKESEAAAKALKKSLQTKEHEKLLNVIDDLRSQGISRFIDLPQIIVCGDQSSGKSSVLEAVSGLKFPTKDALCTRFATELILRRNPKVISTVTIVPDADRSDADKARLSKFKSEKSVYEDLGSIIDHAGKEMGLEGTARVFSTDVLRIELSGPQQPHLTLVDLPGLFHSGSKAQSDADAEAVKALVTGYMKKTRSIILAVVSAKNDYNNQIVTKFAREYDPDGERTLGIITKPDTLPSGSDSEKQYFELAENKDTFFALGWHVLKNRDYAERDCTNEERDASEKQYFSRGIWTSLPPKQLGIDPLRPRLSRVLYGQILAELPDLLRDVESGLRECQGRLDLLGKSRGTTQEQRLHLHNVSDAFTTIIRDAVNGRYGNDFFGNALGDEHNLKRILAVTRRLQDKFAEEMERNGHKWEIVESPPDHQPKRPPYKVTKKVRLGKVKELILRNRGKELATTPKEENITYLFKDQIEPWKHLTEQFAESIYLAVKAAVLAALEATCDQGTRDGVLCRIVNPTLASIKEGFDAEVTRLLRQHSHGYPKTLNHYLTENLQKQRQQHEKEQLAGKLRKHFGKDPNSEDFYVNTTVNLRKLLNDLSTPNEADMQLFACSEALNTMEAYYKVTRKTFVDNFQAQAVQEKLLDNLEHLFTTRIVVNLGDDTVEEIAGESEESKLERDSSERKLAILKHALNELKIADRGQPQKPTKPMTKRVAIFPTPVNGGLEGNSSTSFTPDLGLFD